jgi:hypothetical protein
MLLDLRLVAGPAVELREAQMAVGHERAHRELAGQLKRLLVVALSLFGTRCRRMRRDLTEEAGGPRLAAALLVRHGQVERFRDSRWRASSTRPAWRWASPSPAHHLVHCAFVVMESW